LPGRSSLFVPVIHPATLIFTGDSHALQGDGEVNLTAIETAMVDVQNGVHALIPKSIFASDYRKTIALA
jgi:acetamidase/formamidase